MTTPDLITRYIDNVRNRLPYRLRRDVPLELQSLIEDALEARQPVADEEAAIVEILLEMGSPEELAAQYQTQTHLVGPSMFPIYKMIVVIVLTVLTSVLVALNAIDIFTDGMSLAILERLPRQVFSFLFEEVAQVVGIITIVFWLLQRFNVVFESDAQKDWDPRKLPKAVNPEQFKRGAVIWDLVWTVLILIAVNYFARRTTFFTFGDGTPIGFTDNFRQLLPWISGVLAAEAALYVLLLRQQKWTMLTRALELLKNVALLVMGYFLLNRGDMLTFSAFDVIFKLVAGIVVLVLIIDTIVKGWRFGRAYLIKRQSAGVQTLVS